MYYQGDYYRGDYYQGGIPALLGIGAKILPKLAPKLGKIAGKVGGAIGRAVGRRGSVIKKGGAIAAGGAVFEAGSRGAGRVIGGGGADVAPFRSYRRMQYTNMKALRRAIRRARGFSKLARSVMTFPIEKPPRGRAMFKKGRRR